VARARRRPLRGRLAVRAIVAGAAIAAKAWAQTPPQPSSAPAPHGGQATFARRSGDDATSEARRIQNIARFLLRQSRNVAVAEIDGAEVMAHVGKLALDTDDYRALAALAPGAVLALPGAGACKLRSEADLRFGETVVPAGNVSPGFAGLYSVWLRSPSDAGGEWRLIFNDEADVWGTQRDPAHDRVEVTLAHDLAADEAKELTVAIETGEASPPRPGLAPGESGGTLELRWGPHRWRAPFVVVTGRETAAR
jgi:hypothetical protein